MTLQNANAAAFEAANKVLGESGQHIEALGSDALARWMEENGVEEMNGAYWQRQKLPTGQLALVQVQSPKEVIEAEQLGNTEVSSLMYRTLKVRRQPVKEVAFTYLSWVKMKSFLTQERTCLTC